MSVTDEALLRDLLADAAPIEPYHPPLRAVAHRGRRLRARRRVAGAATGLVAAGVLTTLAVRIVLPSAGVAGTQVVDPAGVATSGVASSRVADVVGGSVSAPALLGLWLGIALAAAVAALLGGAATLRFVRGLRRRAAWTAAGFAVVFVAVAAGAVTAAGPRLLYLPSESMEPTLTMGSRVLVAPWRPGVTRLRRGDVVVFRDPAGWLPPGPGGGARLVQRVIGIPGDRVVCCDRGGALTVNGVPLMEPYLAAGTAPSAQSFDVTVAPGRLFVLGDNRPVSADSRAHLNGPLGGQVPLDALVAVVVSAGR